MLFGKTVAPAKRNICIIVGPVEPPPNLFSNPGPAHDTKIPLAGIKVQIPISSFTSIRSIAFWYLFSAHPTNDLPLYQIKPPSEFQVWTLIFF